MPKTHLHFGFHRRRGRSGGARSKRRLRQLSARGDDGHLRRLRVEPRLGRRPLQRHVRQQRVRRQLQPGRPRARRAGGRGEERVDDGLLLDVHRGQLGLVHELVAVEEGEVVIDDV